MGGDYGLDQMLIGWRSVNITELSYLFLPLPAEALENLLIESKGLPGAEVNQVMGVAKTTLFHSMYS